MSEEESLTPRRGSKFKRWSYILPLLFGLFLSGFELSRWHKRQTLKYVPPSFDKLKTETGILSFTNRWRSTGGSIVIMPINGNILNLSCSEPFSSNACFRVYENGNWVDREKDLVGENATAWWYPDEFSNNYGRIYQLKVKDEIVYTYTQKAGEYVKNYSLESNELQLAIIYFLMFVPLSVYQLIKENKNGSEY